MTNIKFDKTSAIHNICTDKVTLQKEDEYVRTFWDSETLGIEASQEKEMSTLYREILKQFHDSYMVTDSRRVVNLPWKKDKTLSSDNYDVSLQCLKCSQKKFKNTDFQNIYMELMQDYIDKNQVEIAPGSQNPADHISRGISPAELSSLDTWWNGPDWLSH
ncbi:hypothetical protein AVEN_171939-1 [Araneus ventricosus]|uniref:Uncharacterized protein n=1 Tax=Araneus ventricosus TaxID=182803 RepID=A0A4Y2RT58_ARAVE|nr:hypothetical protein AVEN_171939-1 [Araneus ventricosus]